MSAMALRTALRRRRRTAAIVAVLLGLSSALAVHHSDPMAAMPAHGMAVMAGVCLGIVGAAAALRVVTGVVELPRVVVRALGATRPGSAAVPEPAARAGPTFALLQVIRR